MGCVPPGLFRHDRKSHGTDNSAPSFLEKLVPLVLMEDVVACRLEGAGATLLPPHSGLKWAVRSLLSWEWWITGEAVLSSREQESLLMRRS